MTKYTFFAKKAGERTWLPCGGTLTSAPQLHWLELPCLSQVELFSISSLKVWGDAQKPLCSIAYLLVWVEDAKRDRHYGMSLVWVHPNQVREATMEEAVEKLTTFTSSGANWPYALAQLCKDPHHAQLPKNKHLGVLPQGKPQETFCGQISQLEVCPTACCQPSHHLPYRFEWAQ